MTFEKDSGSFYVNKDGCRKFKGAYGETSVINVAKVVLKSKFFSILMNGSTIHMSEKRRRIHLSFQRERFIKEVKLNVTQFLNLPHIWECSARADALKAYLDRSFNLIKEHSTDDNMLKKFISVCRDRASTNIGCNESLLTRLVEEYSHLIPFSCINHQLELVVTESVGKI